MSEMLKQEPAFDDMGRLDTHFVGFDAAAYDTWIAFHNEVEENMGGDEVYSGVRGEGSKAAENAARLACCMHVFGPNPWQPINRETMAGACTLMRWYLAEAVRFARTSGAAPEVGHAQALEEWLVREVKRRGREGQDVLVSLNEARRNGPNRVRRRDLFEAAVELLKDLDRLRIFKRTGAKGLDLILAPAVLREYD